MRKLKLPQIYGILLALLALLIHFLLGFLNAKIVDAVFLKGIYMGVKWMLWPLQLLPFSSLFLFILILLAVFAHWIYRIYSGKLSLVRGALIAINLLGTLIFLFYGLWGYNYRLPRMVDRLQWDVPRYSVKNVEKLYADVTKELIRSRRIWKRSANIRTDMDTDVLSREIEEVEKSWLREHQLFVNVPSRVRPLPAGFLLRLSTSGFYFPFGGEGYWDGGLHDLVIPFVMAHEMAHNFGITDEGEANFVAFRTCSQSTNPYVRYSGYLSFWRYVASQYKQMDSVGFEEKRNCLPREIKDDLLGIREQHNRYPDLFPEFRDYFYDFFLKSQGVGSGIGSYSEVVKLEIAYRADSRPTD